MATISTHRASYNHIHPNMKVGRPRHALSSQEQARLSSVINQIKIATTATSDSQADMALSTAYKMLRNILSERL